MLWVALRVFLFADRAPFLDFAPYLLTGLATRKEFRDICCCATLSLSAYWAPSTDAFLAFRNFTLAVVGSTFIFYLFDCIVVSRCPFGSISEGGLFCYCRGAGNISSFFITWSLLGTYLVTGASCGAFSYGFFSTGRVFGTDFWRAPMVVVRGCGFKESAAGAATCF